jgi:hypothetical protein
LADFIRASFLVGKVDFIGTLLLGFIVLSCWLELSAASLYIHLTDIPSDRSTRLLAQTPQIDNSEVE